MDLLPRPDARRATALLAAALLLGACGTLRAPDSSDAASPAPQAATATMPPQIETAPVPPHKPVPAADAVVPRVERIAKGGPNAPYELHGQRYAPASGDVPIAHSGIASWYGKPFHGRPTASGEVYDMHAMTAAHKTMPLPSWARVRNPANGLEVIVRVNDRGPFKPGRIIDLSYAAAKRLRIAGLARVEVTRLTHDEIRSGAWQRPTAYAPGKHIASAR